jgi:ParB family chromosome partitioning protein
MTKKHSMLDIGLPKVGASVETGEANRQRAEVEPAIRSENDALAHEFVRLKKLGLITDMIYLDDIRVTKLVRDRSRRQDPELGDLMASLQAIGLSNPIRVEPAKGGGYELVEGWRRLAAYRRLLQETGDDRWSRIPASLVPAGETVESLYRRMVDENLVRKDISWSEMARLARAYAEDQVGGCEDLDQAVNLLFASANPQKRSYIRRFAFLLTRLEKHLEHPEAIPRALGLALAHRLEVQPELVTPIVEALRREPRRTAEAELRLLQAFDAGEPPQISPRGNPGRGRPAKRGKTVLCLPLRVGEVKCTAAPGKVELQLDRDFSTVERWRLEAAIAAFFHELG